MLLGVEAGLEGRKVVGRLARWQDEILLPDASPALAIVRGHLRDDGRHLDAAPDVLLDLEEVPVGLVQKINAKYL